MTYASDGPVPHHPTLTVVVRLDGDAFHPSPAPECARILRALADDLEARPGLSGACVILRDADGHAVGTARIITTGEAP